MGHFMMPLSVMHATLVILVKYLDKTIDFVFIFYLFLNKTCTNNHATFFFPFLHVYMVTFRKCENRVKVRPSDVFDEVTLRQSYQSTKPFDGVSY